MTSKSDNPAQTLDCSYGPLNLFTGPIDEEKSPCSVRLEDRAGLFLLPIEVQSRILPKKEGRANMKRQTRFWNGWLWFPFELTLDPK